MAISATPSNHFKYQLGAKALDLASDSIKILLVRDGFTFDKDHYATRLNLKADTGVTSLSVTAGLEYFRAAGSFITDGFVPGNSITGSGFTNGGNNVTKIISTVTADTIVVTNTTGMVQEGAGANERLLAEDEIATGGGYTQDTKVLTGLAVTENDVDDCAYMTCDNVVWSASGGGFGPTPGAILYDDTSADNTIIGYLDFDGNKTISNPDDLVLTGIRAKVG